MPDRTQPGCLFCGIVAGDVPADVVRRDARTIAFRDINPQAPTHVLVVPLDHHETVADVADVDPTLVAEIMSAARDVAAEAGLSDSGFRVVFNNGAGVGQSVFHCHAHVLGGRAFTWPPG